VRRDDFNHGVVGLLCGLFAGAFGVVVWVVLFGGLHWAFACS
jgi:hypothetical protein